MLLAKIMAGVVILMCCVPVSPARAAERESLPPDAETIVESAKSAASVIPQSRESRLEIEERLGNASSNTPFEGKTPAADSIRTLAGLLRPQMEWTVKKFASYVNALNLAQNIGKTLADYEQSVARYKGIVNSIGVSIGSVSDNQVKQDLRSTLSTLTDCFSKAIDNFKTYSIMIWNDRVPESQLYLKRYRENISTAIQQCLRLETLADTLPN